VTAGPIQISVILERVAPIVMDEWVYKIDNRVSLPVSTETLKRNLAEGKLRERDFIRKLPNGAWKSIGSTGFRNFLKSSAVNAVEAPTPVRSASPVRHCARPATPQPLLDWIETLKFSVGQGPLSKLLFAVLSYVVLINAIGLATGRGYLADWLKNEKERHIREAIESDFRSRDASIAQIKQLRAEERALIKSANNAVQRRDFLKDFDEKVCRQLRGGLVIAWRGYLHHITTTKDGASVDIIVDDYELSAEVSREARLIANC
jgi:hypothetical protein